MSERVSHKCFTCKQVFRNTELVKYASPGCKTMQWYCKKCYEDKLAREHFLTEICRIFGVKAPGPQIWTERKRIINEYGYTDNTIIDCLNYVYEVEKKPKKKPTLYFVTPPMVDKMKQFKRAEYAKATLLAQAANQQTREHIVSIKENRDSNKVLYNPDEWLGD